MFKTIASRFDRLVAQLCIAHPLIRLLLTALFIYERGSRRVPSGSSLGINVMKAVAGRARVHGQCLNGSFR